MSSPPTWHECKKWLTGEGQDERALKEQMQECVSSRRPVGDFLSLFEEYLLFLRVQETLSIMKNPAQRLEKTYTDALNRLQTDIDKLVKGTLTNG